MRRLTKNLISMLVALALVVTCVPAMDDTAKAATTVPTISSFTENDDTTCTFTWDAVAGTSYDVYKAESRYATYTKIDTVTEGTYTDDVYDGEYYKVAVAGSKELSEPISYEIDTFGYNAYIFETTDNATDIQNTIDTIYKETEAAQFGQNRYALMFSPGTYSNDITVNIGFYTQAAGLGLSPEDVVLGNIWCRAEWMKGRKPNGETNFNALCNFWRSVENLTTTSEMTMWAVSQATSMRRMNIKGDLHLHHNGGYASGGFLADSKVAGLISGASQQQWLTRNSEMSAFDGVVWNNVLLGCGETIKNSNGEALGGWPGQANTIVAQTPEVAEKPFLMRDETGEYSVFVPAIRKDSEGVSWDGETIEGESIPLSEFFIAKPTTSVDDINAALASGKNLLLTPGIYKYSKAIEVNNADTVILGMGYATLNPTAGNSAMLIGDVAGVQIAGVLFDAGAKKSSTLLTIGTKKNDIDNSENPIILSDTFYRVGGASKEPGTAETCVVINSNNVIGDNFWVWRADHGDGVAWDKNIGDYGVIINGDYVTTYALMVEHFQKYQTQWNGNYGRCYMYQSELPYDITSQDVWNQPGSYGYTDYKVADTVTHHEGYGIGIYSCYQAATCFVKSGIECPDTPGVKFTNVCTYSLSGNGGIDHAINDAGYGVYAGGDMCKVMSYSNGVYEADRTGDSARKVIWSAKVDVDSNKKDDNGKPVYTYSGKAKTPKVTVTYKQIQLREGIDYTVTYKNNTDVGKGKIIINGIGNFKDDKEIEFTIKPAKVKIQKKKSKVTNKKIKLVWKKVTGATGYEVSYSTNKKFKKKLTVTKTVKKTKFTIKRKETGKYYIKVRAFKKRDNNKKKVYGKYSKVFTAK